MSDLISKHKVLIALHESGLCHNNWLEVRNEIDAIPSAEVVLQTPQTYGKSISPNAEIVSDLISRQDAIDAITTDGTRMERMGLLRLTLVEAKQKAVDLLEALPSADRPTGDIVYCKDCVYCTVQNTKYIYAICQRHGIEFKPFEDDTRTHFCAWGERREP